MTVKRRSIGPGRFVAVLLGVGLVVLAGCGSSSKSSSSATTAGGGSATTAGSGGGGSSSGGAPFVIGSVTDVTGAEASSEGTVNKSLEAWADWTNANGGINGHQVKLIAMDTGFNPSTALAEVKQLVEQDHIIALVGEQTSFDATFATYLQQKGIPAVGAGLYTQASFTNPDWFPQGTTTIPENYNEIHLGVTKGFTKFADLYCAESPACAQSVPLIKAIAPTQGVTLAYSASVAAASPDYTAPCLAAKAAGAQYMGIGDNSSVIIRVATSCMQQGYTPTQVGTDGSVTATWATSPAMQGALAVQNDAPFSDTANPGIQTMITALNKYQPGVYTSPTYGENDVYAWTSGLLFTAAAKAANLGDNATAAQVINGLYALHDETLGGMAPPLSYANNGKGHQIYCSFVQGVQNNQFVMPQSQTLTCAPPNTLAPIISAL
jgi:branched-chain amino acid transport system substrate-binding protein